MREILAVTYIKCSFCTAKNHCAACGGELAEALVRKAEITWAAADLPAHVLEVDCSLERADLEDLLDGMGLLLE